MSEERAFSVFRGMREVELWEQVGSPKFTWGQNGQSLVATYKVKYADFVDAFVALLGTTEAASVALSGGGTLGYFKRSIPHSYPHTDTATKLYAESITAGHGEGPRGRNEDKVAAYEWWIFDCIYRPPLYPIATDEALTPEAEPRVPDETGLARYVSVKEEPSLTTLSYKEGSWVWLEGPNLNRTVTVETDIPLSLGSLVLIHHNVPMRAIPRDTINRFKNTVNVDPIPVEGYEYPVNSLLYQFATYEPVTLPDMARAANVHHTWKVKILPDGTGGWLKWHDPAGGNQPYLVGRGTRRMLQGAEHKELFRAASS